MNIAKPLLAVLVIAAACGSSSNSPDAAGTPDASADARPPDAARRVPWSSPHKVWSGTSSLFCAETSQTSDLLTMYASCRPSLASNDYDLVAFTRSAPGADWSTPVPIAELNTPGWEASPNVSADGLSLVFMRKDAGNGTAFAMYSATRAQRSDPWGTPVLEPDFSGYHEVWISADGLTAVATGFFTVEYSLDLYLSTRPDLQSTWSAPQPMTSLDSPEEELGPSLSTDQLELYFTRTDFNQCGDGCINVVTRAHDGDAFEGSGTLVTELNALGDVRFPSLARDGHTIELIVDGSPPGGPFDIYEATR